MNFTEKAFRFLIENKLSDSREYFAANKPTYTKYVLEPLVDLVTALSPAIIKIDSEIKTEAKVDKTISRIYRDTRFSNDKSLYRQNMWIVFSRDKNRPELPAFYADISPEGVKYGMGYYYLSLNHMNTIREKIDNKSKDFIKVDADYRNQNIFTLCGDKYIKTKYKGENKEYAEWYDRKVLYFEASITDFDIIYSDKLAKIIAKDYAKLESAYNFFLKVSEV